MPDGIPVAGWILEEFKYDSKKGNINKAFKYKNLTLSQLGIPKQDVVYLRGNGKEYYIEITK